MPANACECHKSHLLRCQGPTHCHKHCSIRVGQNRKYTPYLTVYVVVFLPGIPYIHRIYIYMVLANPS